ncbi:hypothetical protein [Acetobacter thailandicus]|uniref:hypothetical protein n=1 Tax=Acetobacter thailandicus TaxID=1502842 RepID=UPI001BA48F63|nr:hypothetical protein [Acetobacter thailandicus]MBS1003510.1 hypothetical protein [Acetobacter thailandicus]
MAFWNRKKKSANSTKPSTEDPIPLPSDTKDIDASNKVQNQKPKEPLRDTIETAARAELKNRAKRLALFEWILFIFAIIVAFGILCKINTLSNVFFKKGLIEKLGDMQSWHTLITSDIIFLSLTASFATIFFSLMKLVLNNSNKIQEIADDKHQEIAPVNLTYVQGIISALKDLVLAIKNFQK